MPSPTEQSVQMLAWLQNRRDRKRTARELYGSIVTQARQPIFYAQWGVPDTGEGRFEMILLHMALVLHRLRREGMQGHRLGQALTEAFVVDMDDCLREMTVGDLAVPRKVKRAVAALHDRHSAYADLSHSALQTAVQSRLTQLGGSQRLDSAKLSHYMQRVAAALDSQPGPQILAGRPQWPTPVAVSAGAAP